LKLTVKDKGDLGYFKNDEKGDEIASPKKTKYKLLNLCDTNNFAIVRAKSDGGEIKVFWDLYGSTDDEDEIVKLKRVTI